MVKSKISYIMFFTITIKIKSLFRSPLNTSAKSNDNSCIGHACGHKCKQDDDKQAGKLFLFWVYWKYEYFNYIHVAGFYPTSCQFGRLLRLWAAFSSSSSPLAAIASLKSLIQKKTWVCFFFLFQSNMCI